MTEPNQFHRKTYAAMCRDEAYANRESWLQALQTLLVADESHLP
jgi:hypothetical protein